MLTAIHLDGGTAPRHADRPVPVDQATPWIRSSATRIHHVNERTPIDRQAAPAAPARERPSPRTASVMAAAATTRETAT